LADPSAIAQIIRFSGVTGVRFRGVVDVIGAASHFGTVDVGREPPPCLRLGSASSRRTYRSAHLPDVSAQPPTFHRAHDHATPTYPGGLYHIHRTDVKLRSLADLYHSGMGGPIVHNVAGQRHLMAIVIVAERGGRTETWPIDRQLTTPATVAGAAWRTTSGGTDGHKFAKFPAS
jgi:hypothetical protein